MELAVKETQGTVFHYKGMEDGVYVYVFKKYHLDIEPSRIGVYSRAALYPPKIEPFSNIFDYILAEGYYKLHTTKIPSKIKVILENKTSNDFFRGDYRLVLNDVTGNVTANADDEATNADPDDEEEDEDVMNTLGVEEGVVREWREAKVANGSRRGERFACS